MSKSKYNISESLTDSTNAHNQKDCKLADQICTTKKMWEEACATDEIYQFAQHHKV